MTDLRNVKDEELQAELARRNKEREATERPRLKALCDIDWNPVLKIAEERIKEVESGDSCDSDIPHYMYEATMEACFGANVWDWMNKRMR
jgi:hypothetical protein